MTNSELSDRCTNFRFEVPHRELELLAGAPGEFLQVERRKAVSLRIGAPLRVEHLEDRQPDPLFEVEVMVGVRSDLDQAPALLLLAIVDDIVAGAPFGIAQDAVGVRDLAKPRRVAGFLVVWMKSLRQKPVHAVNRIRVRSGAYLQHVVTVRHRILIHAGGRARHGPPGQTQFRATRSAPATKLQAG